MSAQRHVAVVVGSLRKDSYSRKLAQAVAALAPASLTFDFVPIGELPHYNQDLETDTPPPAWSAFRDRMRVADAVLFCTPEYNRTVPGVLRNAVDVGSRPYGHSIWSGKPAAVISNSPGALGGFGANHHLRQSLVFLDMPTLQQPEAYIANVAALLDANGEIVNDGTRQLLQGFITTFAEWIERHRPG